MPSGYPLCLSIIFQLLENINKAGQNLSKQLCIIMVVCLINTSDFLYFHHNSHGCFSENHFASVKHDLICPWVLIGSDKVNNNNNNTQRLVSKVKQIKM